VHCIVFSTRQEPDPDSDERPSGIREKPMLPGIRIKPKKPTDKLDRFSRIDFSRMYTVEHTVPVYEFGMVHRDYEDKLNSQWIYVLTKSKSSNFELEDDFDDEEDDDADSEEDDIRRTGYEAEYADEDDVPEHTPADHDDDEDEDDYHRRYRTVGQDTIASPTYSSSYGYGQPTYDYGQEKSSKSGTKASKSSSSRKKR
jgi:hypothetical protein